MKSRTQKILKWTNSHRLLSVAVLIIIGLFSWWLVATYMPHPLGDKMEYLGKEDYGNIFGFDSRPASVYYYGTDMSVEELGEYFGKAKIQPSYGGGSGYDTIGFEIKNGTFYIDHYWEKSVAPFKTDKKYIVAVGSTIYSTARNAIK